MTSKQATETSSPYGNSACSTKALNTTYHIMKDVNNANSFNAILDLTLQHLPLKTEEVHIGAQRAT